MWGNALSIRASRVVMPNEIRYNQCEGLLVFIFILGRYEIRDIFKSQNTIKVSNFLKYQLIFHRV